MHHLKKHARTKSNSFSSESFCGYRTCVEIVAWDNSEIIYLCLLSVATPALQGEQGEQFRETVQCRWVGLSSTIFKTHVLQLCTVPNFLKLYNFINNPSKIFMILFFMFSAVWVQLRQCIKHARWYFTTFPIP